MFTGWNVKKNHNMVNCYGFVDLMVVWLVRVNRLSTKYRRNRLVNRR